MHPDYKQWLKDKGYTGNTYFSDAERVEANYGDLEEHLKNGTYQDIMDNIPYKSPLPIKTALDKYRIFLKEQSFKTYDEYQKILNDGIKDALSDSHKARLARLKKAPKKPLTRTITTKVYIRSYDVIAEVLIRANGICENCNNLAPFIKEKDKTPYLEVHHKTQLANNGDDTVENAEALCPNCHREKHYGAKNML